MRSVFIHLGNSGCRTWGGEVLGEDVPGNISINFRIFHLTVKSVFSAFYLYMYSSLDFGVETGNLELANFIMRSVTKVSASLFRESIQP